MPNLEEIAKLYQNHLNAKAAAEADRAALEAALDEGEIYSPSPLPIVQKVNGKLVETTPLPLVLPPASGGPSPS